MAELAPPQIDVDVSWHERIRQTTAETMRLIGRATLAGAMVVAAAATSWAAAESVEPTAAYAATVTPNDLGYPWKDAPCKFSNTDAACTNPNDPSDKYDWGVFDAKHVFQPYRNGYEYRNCTDYAQWRIGQLGGTVPAGLGNGGKWYDNAPAAERLASPKAGVVAVAPGSVGHVAVVEGVGQDGTITVSEYNYDEQGHGDTRTGKPGALGFTEFIDFGADPSKAQPPASPAPAPAPPYKRGDFTHDGKADIAWYEQWKNAISILKSDGTTLQVQPWQTGLGAPDWAGVGDFDGNGFADVAWYEQWKNRITVLINHGGWFSLEDFMDGVGKPTWAGVGDFNGDGRDDIAWYEQPTSNITILQSSGSRFGGVGKIVGIGAPTWAGIGDFDGDKKADIAWDENWKAAITVFSGGKAFGPSSWRTGIGGPTWAGVGDFDNDGKDDIAWYEQWQNNLAILHSGGSSFDVWGGVAGIGAPGWAGAGDFTGDGKDDIAWYEVWKNGITVLKSQEPGGFGLYTGVTGVGGPTWAAGRNGSTPGTNGS